MGLDEICSQIPEPFFFEDCLARIRDYHRARFLYPLKPPKLTTTCIGFLASSTSTSWSYVGAKEMLIP